jgi:hypothetical protein
VSDLAVLSIQSVKTVLGANPDKSLAVFVHGPDHVVTQAVGIAGLVPIVGKWRRFAGEPADAALGANPNYSLGILEHGLNGIVRQGIRIACISSVAKQFDTITVPLEQSLINRTHPQSPIPGVKEAVHAYDALAAYLFRVKGVIRETASLHIKGAQSVSELRAYPDDTGVVLGYRTYVIEAKAVRILWIVKETRKTGSGTIQLVEAFFRANPKITPAVFEDRFNVRGTQGPEIVEIRGEMREGSGGRVKAIESV